MGRRVCVFNELPGGLGTLRSTALEAEWLTKTVLKTNPSAWERGVVSCNMCYLVMPKGSLNCTLDLTLTLEAALVEQAGGWALHCQVLKGSPVG